MTKTQTESQDGVSNAHLKIWRRIGIGIAVLAIFVILFGVVGYFWLPGYAKSQLEERLSELLERPVSVQAIEIKPYTLELMVNGFRIGERQDSIDAAESFVAFDTLHIDVSSRSIAQRAPVLSTITLDTLRVRLTREDEHVFNFSDLIEKFLQPSDDEDSGALFSIRNIVLKNSAIEWIDRFEQTRQEISDINVAVPLVTNLNTAKSDWIKPQFDAKINGAQVSLDGKLKPFTDQREVSLVLRLANIDLTRIVRYIPFPAGISLESGLFDSDLVVTFSQSGEDEPAITLSGKAALQNLAVINKAVQTPYRFNMAGLHVGLVDFNPVGTVPSRLAVRLNDAAVSSLTSTDGSNEPVISISKLATKGLTVDMSKQHVELSAIAVDKLSGRIHREAGGNIDLTRLFEPSDADVTVVSKAGGYVFLVPKPRKKPSAEAYDTWLQANRDMLPEDNGQTVALGIPVPAKKPSYEVWAEQVAQAAPEPVAAKKVEEKSGSWSVQINQFRLNNAALYYADLTLVDVAPMVIKPLDLTVTDIDISGVKPLKLNLAARVNEYGVIEADGNAAWSPLAVDLNLNLQTVDLVSLQGWAGDKLNVLLTSGDFSFQGTVKGEGEPLKVAINGQSRMDNLNLFNQYSARDMLSWKSMNVTGLKVVSDPLDIDVDTIELGDFFARVMLLPDGELNFNHIVRQDEVETPVEPVQEDNGAPEESVPIPLRIGNIVLQQGNVDFYDRFVEPNYHVNLTGLTGKIGPIQTNRSGSIDVKGEIDDTAPLEIRGTIEPFGSEPLLDIVAKAKEIDLPPLSPYSGKYVGYGIEKGKLSVDVHYHIEQGKLTAENNVFLDQLTLGDRVESEEAASVPLKLALAILKNRRGEIDIHLPIQGSLDDPQFSLGDIVLGAVMNLITRAVTAPFALLGSMFGDGEELSEISFPPGFASIDSEAESRLQALSEILKDRPALNLEIVGRVDPDKDYEGLKLAILQRQIKSRKLTADAKQGKTGGSLANVTLSPEEYSKYLKVVYKAADFEKPTNMIGLTKGLPDEEMEQLLLSHTEVSDDDMQELAQDRAIAAQNWLLDKGGVSGDRLFVLGRRQLSESDNNAARVEFTLK